MLSGGNSKTGLENLWKLSDAKSRSISPENFTGEKGKGGMATEGTAAHRAIDLGVGWKISPSIHVAPGECRELADIKGPGVIQHIWLTNTGAWRNAILRVYWDDLKDPSIECPIGDFFASGWNEYSQLTSLAVCVNPGRAFNCYWPMPFRKKCKITFTNTGEKEMELFYQIAYSLEDIPEEAGYFHAQFRRINPLPYGDVYTILDGVKGKGNYVGTYLAWGVNNSGWWGHGELKFYMDGDDKFPTICGTGLEDYFCGAWDFDPSVPEIDEGPDSYGYVKYTTPYAGLSQIIKPDGKYQSQMRFGMYRWHITDPIRFQRDLRVTVQALGWRKDGRYIPLQDDIASVAYWYQSLPHEPFPTLPDKDYLEIL